MAKNVYEKMAASELICTNQLTSGNRPTRKFIVQFVYANGLVVNYDGEKWAIIKEGH